MLPRLPGLLPADDGLFYGMVLRPNCFLSLISDHVIVLFPPDTLAEGQCDVSDAVALFARVNEQDFAAAQWCQPNMSSRAYRGGGVLVPSEAEVDLTVLCVVSRPAGHHRQWPPTGRRPGAASCGRLIGEREWHSSTGRS